MKNTQAPAIERPLSGSAYLTLVLSATVVIALCYAGCLLALLLIGVVLAVQVAVLVALARVGLASMMVEPIRGELRLASLVLRSLNLQGGPEYHMLLPREDAPRLYDVVGQVAGRVAAPPPDRMVLEMSANAWVQLHGFRRGRGRATLGIGFDLLVVLEEGELEAVVAHEMAHAKLVQRGYAGWLRNGIGRMGQLAAALDWVSGAARQEGKRFWSAAWLARGTDLLARLGSRLVAAYSRQDEFAADRMAAQICGPDVYRQALVKIHVASTKARDLSWRDRLLQWGREESVSDWLRIRLTAAEEERLEMEQQALQESRRGEFDTHPVLADRLAALPEGTPAARATPLALGLLRDPEAVAVRLLEELERIANEEERKQSRQLRRWLQKEVRGRKHTPLQWVGVVISILGLFFLLASVLPVLQGAMSPSQTLPWLAVGAVLLVVGGGIYQKGMFREKRLLPAPAWSRWRDAMQADLRARPIGDWYEPLAAEMRLRLPADLRGRRAQARYWAGECYQELERCDFQRALVAARFSQQLQADCLEGALGHGVAAAYFRETAAVEQMLGWALGAYGLGHSVSWAVGWAFSMLGNWPSAEAYLLDAATRRPEEPTLRAMLGMCQWQEGKLREAAQSVQEAIAQAPGEPHLRLLLMRILLASGRAKEALRELEAVEAEVSDDFDAMLGAVSANLLLGRTDEASRRTERLEQAHPGPLTLLRLGQVHGDASLHEPARRYLEAASEAAFYPEACLGLARIAYEAKDLGRARRYLLAALDLTREPGPEASSPLGALEDVARGLAAMAEPVEECQAWTATLDLSGSPAPVQRLHLLVVAPALEHAQEQARCLCQAMHPDRDPATAPLSWQPADPSQRPEGPVRPGIYAHRFE